MRKAVEMRAKGKPQRAIAAYLDDEPPRRPTLRSESKPGAFSPRQMHHSSGANLTAEWTIDKSP
jgi:hypothetical protein